VLQRLRKQIESHFGFQILLARTEVGGYCAHCQALRAREVDVARRQEAPAEAAPAGIHPRPEAPGPLPRPSRYRARQA